MARLGARCLAAVSAYDSTLEIVDTLDVAQAKFDDILNSPSVDMACEKIKSLAKAKELDSSLILLINGAWASAKESTTMKNEVRDTVYIVVHQVCKIFILKLSLTLISIFTMKLLSLKQFSFGVLNLCGSYVIEQFSLYLVNLGSRCGNFRITVSQLGAIYP